MRIPAKEFLRLEIKLIFFPHESKSNQEKEFGENLENKRRKLKSPIILLLKDNHNKCF